MSKYTDLQDSSISKFAYTERKSTRSVLGQYDSYEKDYALEKQYLEKLKSQRVKAEKLFEEYTAISKDLKREREINSKLREEIDELRNARSNEVEKGKAEILLLRTETEQQRTDIKTLLADKSTLIKRFKELESELACLDTLREEEEEQRHRVQELEEKLFESTNEFKSEAKEYELKLENLLERNL
jgi:chromosome segregation ATPase